ncbi:uncharacterized transmembrane protein DDB_G0289901-like isoform X2 [Oppia nitens]|uniref:uncharacterized transmembrane protein DDB_G0289901-like isoform X2 n=1 Tax=Oppia nitens TaxID=1686743 RepID=UPI0023DB66E1|nr:uncharacterized transmembrane protein DDB_G0289901-like isoform X2 [Oppia nitens]
MFGKQLVSLLTILVITVFNCYFCYKTIVKECSDLPSIHRREWGARVPRQSLAPAQLPVPHLFIYHTSSYSRQCLDLNSCIRAVRYIQDYQMDTQELRDISYNALIGGDGRIYWGRSTQVVGSQPVGLHDKSLSVAFIGQYDNQEPSQLMLDTAKRLVQCFEKLGDRLTGDYQLHGHRDQSCTQSPGQNVYNAIRQWPHFQGGPLPTYRCNKTASAGRFDSNILTVGARDLVGRLGRPDGLGANNDTVTYTTGAAATGATGGIIPANNGGQASGGISPANVGGQATGGISPANNGGPATGGIGPANNGGPATGAAAATGATGGISPANVGGQASGGISPANNGGPATGGISPANNGGPATGAAASAGAHVGGAATGSPAHGHFTGVLTGVVAA